MPTSPEVAPSGTDGYRNSYCSAKPNAYSHGDHDGSSESNTYANFYTHTYANSHGHGDCGQSDSDTYFDANGHCDSYGCAKSYAHADSNARIGPGSHDQPRSRIDIYLLNSNLPMDGW